jgi:hypothetical protein
MFTCESVLSAIADGIQIPSEHQEKCNEMLGVPTHFNISFKTQRILHNPNPHQYQHILCSNFASDTAPVGPEDGPARLNHFPLE